MKNVKNAVSFRLRKTKNATGCLKKTWTIFEIGIIPLFFKVSFQNFVWP